MKTINTNKVLPIMLGVAGLYWATNKKLPDWLIVSTLLATGVTLAIDVTELVIESETAEAPRPAQQSYTPQISLSGLDNKPCCENCANKSLPFNPFGLHF